MNTKFATLLGLSLGLFLAPARAADPKPAQPEKPTTVAPPAKTREGQGGGSAATDARNAAGQTGRPEVEIPRPPPPAEIRDVVENFRQQREQFLNRQRELRQEMSTATQERRREIREQLAALRQEQIQPRRTEARESLQNAAQQAQEQARRIQAEQAAAAAAAAQAAREQARGRGRE